MKITLILLAASSACVEALYFRQNGAVSPDKHESVLDNNPEGIALADIHNININITDPVIVLQSEECAPLLEDINTNLNTILDEFTNEEILEFACNTIERKMSKERLAAAGRDLATQDNPCIRAFEELEMSTEDAKVVVDSLNDKSVCKAELQKILIDMRDKQTHHGVSAIIGWYDRQELEDAIFNIAIDLFCQEAPVGMLAGHYCR